MGPSPWANVFSLYTVWTCLVLIYDCPLFFYYAPLWRVWVYLLSNTLPPVWTQVLLLCHVKPHFHSRLNKPRSFSFPSQGKWSVWLSLLSLFLWYLSCIELSKTGCCSLMSSNELWVRGDNHIFRSVLCVSLSASLDT